MRKSPAYRKLVVDDLVMWIFPASRIPKLIRRLSFLRGIELLPASKEERKPFIEKEKDLKKRKERRHFVKYDFA